MHNIDSPWFRAGQDLIKGINNIKFQMIKTFETFMKYSSRYQLVNIKSTSADPVRENRAPIKLWTMSCVPFLSSSIGIKYQTECWISLVSPINSPCSPQFLADFPLLCLDRSLGTDCDLIIRFCFSLSCNVKLVSKLSDFLEISPPPAFVSLPVFPSFDW